MNYDGLWAIIEDPEGNELKFFAKSLFKCAESDWSSTLEKLLLVEQDTTIAASTYSTPEEYVTNHHWELSDTYIYNNTFITRSQAENLYPEYFI